MAISYVLSDDGGTTPMERVRCVNEDKELQLVLEKNLDLLPGDQINPDDPCRWLQIAREMPVPDPNTATNRWSVDFFLSDQNAIPTFIECKRFNDTRSRREVIGQMFEYAANGHQYWDREVMRELAQTRDDQGERQRLVARRGEDWWGAEIRIFEHLRMGRLASYLRRIEPLDHINYTILIYRLTDEQVTEALHGPPVELFARSQLRTR